MQVAAHQAEQTRLAAAVLTGDANLLAPKQAKSRVGEQHPRAASQGDISEIQHASEQSRAIRPARLAAAAHRRNACGRIANLRIMAASSEASMLNSNNFATTAAVAAIVAFGIYRRVRRNIGRQTLTARRQYIRMTIISVVCLL